MTARGVNSVSDNIESIQLTLLGHARPGITVDELFRITKRTHPDATKTQFIHAAIGALIAVADSDLERALMLQNFAIRGRGRDD